MAGIIKEPQDCNPLTADWQSFLYRTTFQGGGFLKIMLTDLNTSGVPRIAKGSRLEVNGTFYLVAAEEAVNNTYNVANEQWIFIYAVPQNQTLIFEYRNTMPVYSAEKNGYYSDFARAVAKMYKRRDGYWSKVILNDYESLYEDNFSVLPTVVTNCIVVAEGEIEKSQLTDSVLPILLPGAYRYSIKGGKGGKGGSYISGSQYYYGGDGHDGELKEESFFTDKPMKVFLSVGYDGKKGNDYTPITFFLIGFAQGGIQGRMSFMKRDGDVSYIVAEGGSGGGGGANGSVQNISTANGFSGYGVGEDGNAPSGYIAGRGGKEFTPSSIPGIERNDGKRTNIFTLENYSSEHENTTSGYARIYKLWESIRKV